MLTIGSPKKYLLLSKILVFVLLLHSMLFIFSLISKKPLQISLDMNKSALDVAFKVDYTKKRVDDVKLQTPRKNLPTSAPKKENKQQLNLATVLKQLPSSSKIEVAPAKQLSSALEKFKPKAAKVEKPISKPVVKNQPPKIEKPVESKPVESKPEVKTDQNKLKGLVDSLHKKAPENLDKIKTTQDEELILGREQFDEVKLALQIHEQIQARWQPPHGLQPTKPSKWLVKIKAGQKIVEKVAGSGILVFDMAAQQTLLNTPLDFNCPDIEIEISFTA